MTAETETARQVYERDFAATCLPKQLIVKD